MNHGTVAGYKTEGCRCVACRMANREYEAERRGKPVTYRHGTYESYLNGCRQPCCARVCQTPDWFDQAACIGMETSLFYPERGYIHEVRAAKAVCEGCPVRWRCLNHALTDVERYGIWGGTSEKQRQRMRTSKSKRSEVARMAYLEGVGLLGGDAA